jgi:hypothetical protein
MLTIPEAKMKRILSLIGYPVVRLEDITGSYMTEDDVVEQLLWPALQEYWEYFPLTEKETYSFSSTFEVSFPDEQTYGVISHKFLDGTEGGKTASPFMNSILYTRSFGGGGNWYNTKRHYDMRSATMLEQSEHSSYTESQKAQKVNVDKKNRKVTGYSNVGSRLEIGWAKWSEDWSDIPFEDENDVIKLCQSNVLQFFGELRNQETGSLPTELSGDDFVSKAEDLREAVMEKWLESTRGPIIR